MAEYKDCLGIITVKVPASWLLSRPEALGRAWIRGQMGCILIGGIDALVDGTKVILEYGSCGEKEVDPTYEVEVSKRAYEEMN